MTAADRFFRRLEPVAFADAENDDALFKLATALMAPRDLMELARDTPAGMDVHTRTDAFNVPDGPLPAPWAAWLGALPDVEDYGVVPGGTDYGDAIHADVVSRDCFTEMTLRSAYSEDMAVGVGLRLTSQSDTAAGYAFDLSPLTAATIWSAPTFDSLVSVPVPAGEITGVRAVAQGPEIQGWCRVDGTWTMVASVEDTAYTAAGRPGFWTQQLEGTVVPIESVSWGARTTRDYIAWGMALDPDAAPDGLLDWLATYAGTVLPPSALTTGEKRYRILQSAGRYRGTPRAVIEELQLHLTGSKTVYVGFHTPDEWHYSIATIDSETPDAAAVERAVLAQKPVGMLVDVFTTAVWSSFVLGPTLIGYRDGDGYQIGTPEYPTCQSVLDSFATCQDLLDNDPI